VCSGYSEIRTLEEAELQAKEIIDDLIKRQHEDDLLEADLAAEY
jgi:predicted RNase H-like HicB family nuclease